ncbi:hypothetical protein [Serratia sp. D1N4]
MKMVLPVEGYSSASELMSALQGGLGDAFWLFKSQGHWHGGIHLNDRFYAGGVYDPSGQRRSGLNVMTDGQIVAYRLNDDYLTAAYKLTHLPKAFRFTSTFVLIKSTCTPDTEKPDNALDFYTLWIQLAPLAAYGLEANTTAKVVASSLKVRQDNPATGWVRSGLPQGATVPTSADGQRPYAVPVESQVVLPRNSVVEILEEANFFLRGRVAPFAFVRVKTVPEGRSSTVEAGMAGWVSGLERYLKRQTRPVPAWIEAARKKGIFNEVVTLKGDEVIQVKAGDVIGHMGRHESPFEPPNHFSHLEVFSQDSRLPDFVANKTGFTGGEPLIRSLAGKTRYLYQEEGNTFAVFGGDDPSPTHEDRFTPMGKSAKKMAEGKDWYYVPEEGAWLPVNDVTLVNQFDLAKRGFVLLKEEAPPKDVQKARQEPWFREVFEQLKAQADSHTQGMYSATVSEGYQRLLREMDRDGDGKVSNSELWQYLHCREKHIQDQVQRFIVKHHSEWVHDANSALWQSTLAEMAKRYPGDAEYNRQHINAMVWMKHVPEIRSGEALWHLHPVAFLEALSSSECNCEELYANRFKVTKYGTQYGPVYWGEITLASYARWDKLISEGQITQDEKTILIAMSENEGKMDAIQSYDSEVITAGAMQKTVKDEEGREGKGELPTQLAKFRDLHPDLYENYVTHCGWSVEGTGSSAIMYYSDQVLTQGNRITASDLKTLIRQGSNATSYGSIVHNKPLAALLKVILLPEYLDIQVLDFIQRLHQYEGATVTSENKKIKDFVKSKFGRAVVLDHSVNRPGYVVRDFKKAIRNFHSHNPAISLDPQTWGAEHNFYENKLLEEYKLTREMTNSIERYNSLRIKL